MSLAGTSKRLHSRNGAAYTIRREARSEGANDWTAGTVSVSYFACTARERPNSFRVTPDLRGGLQQDDVRISVDAALSAETPRKGDRIAKGTFDEETDDTADWLQVVSVASPEVGGVVHRHVLLCRK